MPDIRAQLEDALGSMYTIEHELGGGGMSRVILARDRALGRDVVIKMLTRELAEGVSAERFEREIMLAARLQQANIVPVLSAGDARGVPYYTMPFVDGLSLRTRLERGPIPLGEALEYARLGMPDSVFSRLAVAVRAHDDSFTHLITSPAFASVESDPRWDAIVGAVRRQ
jgi:serine/threonine-protein kinase